MARQIQRFQVALKALIVRDDRLLVVRESNAPGYWEFPGGRIEVGEEALPQPDVLRREILEELGPDFRCTIGAPLVTWTRELQGKSNEWGLLIGYACDDIAGEIRLSDEHSELRWVDRATWRELAFAPGYQAALENFWRRWVTRTSP